MSDELASMVRMPTVFGPSPGPRNLPRSKRHRRYEKRTLTVTLSATTDERRLATLLPPGFSIEGEPRVEMVLMRLTDIGWLAGRGYDIVMVRIPARWRGQDETVGHFVPVLWENLPDPVLTGREELGWSKIYADISASTEDGRCRACASWDGFTFFEMEVDGVVASGPPPPALPMMFHKYIPRTGDWGASDVDYITMTAPDGPAPSLDSSALGRGRFSFRRARWEDMPTQYHIVNALADLPLGDFAPATLVQTTGGGDGSGQRRLK